METGLPQEFMAGSRTYRLVPFNEPDKPSVNHHTMLEQGHREQASMGEEHGQHILKCWRQLPPEYRDHQIVLVFPEWRGSPGHIACLFWFGHELRLYWTPLKNEWEANFYLVRFIASA